MIPHPLVALISRTGCDKRHSSKGIRARPCIAVRWIVQSCGPLLLPIPAAVLFARSVVVPSDLPRPKRLEEMIVGIDIEDQNSHDKPPKHEAPDDVHAKPDPCGKHAVFVHFTATEDADQAEEDPDSVLEGQQNEGIGEKTVFLY
mmetsp:Transcript_7253/g.17686  ORF Transcript_7253/g.17686 Transcript_7253/m.17686 type:complete len:145 (+) Transcript_7253:225-659(+)